MKQFHYYHPRAPDLPSPGEEHPKQSKFSSSKGVSNHEKFL